MGNVETTGLFPFPVFYGEKKAIASEISRNSIDFGA